MLPKGPGIRIRLSPGRGRHVAAFCGPGPAGGAVRSRRVPYDTLAPPGLSVAPDAATAQAGRDTSRTPDPTAARETAPGGR